MDSRKRIHRSFDGEGDVYVYDISPRTTSGSSESVRGEDYFKDYDSCNESETEHTPSPRSDANDGEMPATIKVPSLEGVTKDVQNYIDQLNITIDILKRKSQRMENNVHDKIRYIDRLQSDLDDALNANTILNDKLGEYEEQLDFLKNVIMYSVYKYGMGSTVVVEEIGQQKNCFYNRMIEDGRVREINDEPPSPGESVLVVDAADIELASNRRDTQQEHVTKKRMKSKSVDQKESRSRKMTKEAENVRSRKEKGDKHTGDREESKYRQITKRKENGESNKKIGNVQITKKKQNKTDRIRNGTETVGTRKEMGQEQKSKDKGQKANERTRKEMKYTQIRDAKCDALTKREKLNECIRNEYENTQSRNGNVKETLKYKISNSKSSKTVIDKKESVQNKNIKMKLNGLSDAVSGVRDAAVTIYSAEHSLGKENTTKTLERYPNFPTLNSLDQCSKAKIAKASPKTLHEDTSRVNLPKLHLSKKELVGDATHISENERLKTPIPEIGDEALPKIRSAKVKGNEDLPKLSQKIKAPTLPNLPKLPQIYLPRPPTSKSKVSKQ